MSRHVNLPVDREELAAVIAELEQVGIRDSYGEHAKPLPRFLRRAKILRSELDEEHAAAEAAGEDAALAPPSLAEGDPGFDQVQRRPEGLTAADKAWTEGRE